MHNTSYLFIMCTLLPVKSVVELVRYSLTKIPGVEYVLTEHPFQNPLEAFFGRQRMSYGHNDNPNIQTFLQNTVSLRIQGSAAPHPFRGNWQGVEITYTPHSC